MKMGEYIGNQKTPIVKENELSIVKDWCFSRAKASRLDETVIKAINKAKKGAAQHIEIGYDRPAPEAS